MPEALVLGLAADIADIDLLDDDGELEGGEHLVPADRSDIEPGARGIALDRIRARRKPLAPGRHRRDLAPGGVIARFDPVIEEIAEIGERIPLGAHVPIEDGRDTPGIAAVEEAVVETVVVMQEAR